MATVSPPRPATPPPPPRPAAPPGTSKPPPWQGAAGRAAQADDLATLCLLVLTVTAGLGFARLFSGASFVPYMLGAAVLGHCGSWALRRVGAGLTVASIAAVVGSVVSALWLVSPHDTTFGFITPSTLEKTSSSLAAARDVFQSSVAPVTPVPGLLLTMAFGVTLVGFLADWAAFRMRATFEAVVPAFAILVITAIFGTAKYRTVSVGAFAATALVFLIVHRAALDAERGTWFGGRSVGALPSLLTTGALLGAAALVAGLLVGPSIPGATAQGLVKWRGQGPGSSNSSRSTISPLVDIRGRLVSPSDAEVFRVKADRAAYWRLTSLDTFDGNIWSSNEKYRQAKGTLVADAGLIGQPLVQEVTISALSSIWLPAAYRPQKISGAKGISYSERSASLISREATSDGITYEITSVVPDLSPALLRSEPASTGATSGLGDLFGGLTARPRVDRRVLDLVNRLTAGKTTSFDKAKAIQDHLRTFTYDLNVGAGHSTDALARFLLVSKRGYCEQFAGAFAVLARLIGLPSRVAVGFQTGRAGGEGSFQVRDKDAHAWPEVYFEGVGWVAFEPTPNDGVGSNGNPAAAAYTGVPYTPAPADDGTGTSGETNLGQSPVGSSGASTSTTIPKEENVSSPTVAVGNSESSLLYWLILVLGFLALMAVQAAALVGTAWWIAERRRQHRREAATTPALRVAHAWLTAEEALGLVRVTRRSTMTVDEWIDRLKRPAGGAASAGVERGTPGHEALVRLGRAVVDVAYSDSAVSEGTVAAAEADAKIVIGAAHERAGWWRVFDWMIDPHPAFDDWRRARTERRPRVAVPAEGT
jgi:transglutaminase-like putative cysteine protease